MQRDNLRQPIESGLDQFIRHAGIPQYQTAPRIVRLHLVTRQRPHDDIKAIGALGREIDGPLNIVMGFTGNPLSAAELHALGVKRVSIGGSLARATYGLIRQAAQEMRETGTFRYADQQIPDAELSKFFAAWGSGS